MTTTRRATKRYAHVYVVTIGLTRRLVKADTKREAVQRMFTELHGSRRHIVGEDELQVREATDADLVEFGRRRRRRGGDALFDITTVPTDPTKTRRAHQ
jgi:hypothetical protein